MVLPTFFFMIFLQTPIYTYGMKCLWPLVIYSTPAWGVHTLPTDDQMPYHCPHAAQAEAQQPLVLASPTQSSGLHFRTSWIEKLGHNLGTVVMMTDIKLSRREKGLAYYSKEKLSGVSGVSSRGTEVAWEDLKAARKEMGTNTSYSCGEAQPLTAKSELQLRGSIENTETPTREKPVRTGQGKN